MNVDTIKTELETVLKAMHPDVDFEKEESLVDDGIIDSFDLVTLISEMTDRFDIRITALDFQPENFNSLEKMAALVLRKAEE